MPQYFSPGVYIEEGPIAVPAITGVASSIALFVGWAPRGPVDRAVRLTRFADFARTYGGLDRRSLLGYSVRHFYENGGVDAYVLRIADHDAETACCGIGDLTVRANSPGSWANAYQVRLTRRADAPTRFGLDVLHPSGNGAVVESFDNLSMHDSDARSVKAVVNGRSGIIVVDATGATTPGYATVNLGAAKAGADGTVFGPDDPDFRSALLACFGAGSVTARIDLFNLLCVPGLTDGAAIAMLQRHCRDRRAFLIVDSPRTATVSNAPRLLSGMTGDDAANSAVYFPWARAPDPLRRGALRVFPPCGFVAGVYARTDRTRGVWKAPAGTEARLAGAIGLAVAVSDAASGLLNKQAINCLRTLPAVGNVVWGARTLHGDDDRGSQWKYVPVRRTALFIEESVYRGIQWAVFEPNDEPLWARIRLIVGAFMQDLFRRGAFQGSSPRDAYFVKCDRETTTQNDIDCGRVNILVGFAPLKPAEFVVIIIQQAAGQAPA